MRTKTNVWDEQGHLHYVEDDVFHALVSVGAIWHEHGRYCCRADLDLRKYPELVICDFCHERPVTWIVDATTFQLADLKFTSIGEWAACEPCGQAIFTNDRKTLELRSLAMVHRESPSYFLHITQLRLLEQFWKHYRGITRYAPPYKE